MLCATKHWQFYAPMEINKFLFMLQPIARILSSVILCLDLRKEMITLAIGEIFKLPPDFFAEMPEARARRKGGGGGIPPRPSVPPERSGGGSVSLKMVSRKV